MNKGIDPSNELTKKDFANSDISFTHKLEDLKKAMFYLQHHINQLENK
jgi:hypothetical protein